LIRAIDRERLLIGRELDLDILSEPELGVIQGYMTEATYDAGYSQAPGFQGIKAQPHLNNRYFNEDVGYWLFFWGSLGPQLGLDNPPISAVIRLASIVLDREYLVEAERTMETLGLSSYTTGEERELLA
jgi:opine dehydrogenase